MNGLNFIQEFAKYVEKFTNEIEFYQNKRNFFHYGYRNFAPFYYYDIKEQSMYLIRSYKIFDNIPIIYLDLTEISKFVKFKIKFITSTHLRYHADDGSSIKYFMLSGFYKEEVAVHTIERYWLKYRLNYHRNKIQPLKRDLMAWLYHPSRVNFEL